MDIHEIVKQRVLIMDGAMGTMIQSYNLKEGNFRNHELPDTSCSLLGNYDVLNLVRPDIIEDIHCRYLKVGTDIITTNTFNSQCISQSDYQIADKSRDMTLAGARIARKCADRFSAPDSPRFVAGSIGPTNKRSSCYGLSNHISVNELQDAYQEQIGALLEGGVDLLLIETITDLENVKVAIEAAEVEMKDFGKCIPLMLSVTLDEGTGRILAGQSLQEFLQGVASYNIFSVGLNCFRAQSMTPFLYELATKTSYYISVCPSAGTPNRQGIFEEAVETITSQLVDFMDKRLVNIVGGCCGTSDKHILAFTNASLGKVPHVPLRI